MKPLIQNLLSEKQKPSDVLCFFSLVYRGLHNDYQNVFSKEVGFFNQPYGNIGTNWGNTMTNVYPKMANELVELLNKKRSFLWKNYIIKFLDHLSTINNFVVPQFMMHQIMYHPKENTLEFVPVEKYLKVPTIKWAGAITVDDFINQFGNNKMYSGQTLNDLISTFINNVNLFKTNVDEARNKISQEIKVE